MSDDVDPQELSMRMQAIQQQLQQTERHAAMMERGVQEIQQAIDTLTGLDDADGDQDVLMPIGGGVQVPARVSTDAQVITEVGAGYATKQTLQDAAQSLREQRDDAQQELGKVNQHLQQLQQEGQRVNQQLSSMQQSRS